MKIDKVIVTVCIHDNLRLDLEMPIFIQISELSNKVLEILKYLYPENYYDVEELFLIYEDNYLDEKSNLAINGIWDGSLLKAEWKRRDYVKS